MELVALLAVTALLSFALVRAFVAATVQEGAMDEVVARQETLLRFENSLRDVIRRAALSPTTGDPASYFLGGALSIGGSGTEATSVVFTALRYPSDALLGSEATFEEINERYGPPAGMEEISLSMTPYGDAGGRTGLFLRRQTPADGDPTQGGYEELLSPDVASIRFEFFDGREWITAWDTTAQAEPRLPAAVRVIYTYVETPDIERTFVVKLPHSDVTPLDPAVNGGGL